MKDTTDSYTTCSHTYACDLTIYFPESSLKTEKMKRALCIHAHLLIISRSDYKKQSV